MLQDRLSLALRVPFRRTLVVLGLAVAVALTLPAANAAAVKPTLADRMEARATCISERGSDIVKHREFRLLYGGRKPFRRCVKFHARQIAAERVLEAPMIRAECQLGQAEDPLGFAQEYPGPDPVGLCVRMESMP
jgi:hypothetical protein